MNNENLLWKDERIRALEESLAFFSNREKLNREKWTVSRLLRALGIDFKEKELTAAEEPVGISFRDMRFQEKEILDKNRRRTDEYKKTLEIVKTAKDYSELLEMYNPIDISFVEVVQKCYEYANNLLLKSKYGPHECKNIDLIYYFNLVNYFIVPPTQFEIKELEFRSLSVVSNRYCVVAYAKEDAPIILRNNVGITKDSF
jgi:hypothetical protein